MTGVQLALGEPLQVSKPPRPRASPAASCSDDFSSLQLCSAAATDARRSARPFRCPHPLHHAAVPGYDSPLTRHLTLPSNPQADGSCPSPCSCFTSTFSLCSRPRPSSCCSNEGPARAFEENSVLLGTAGEQLCPAARARVWRRARRPVSSEPMAHPVWSRVAVAPACREWCSVMLVQKAARTVPALGETLSG